MSTTCAVEAKKPIRFSGSPVLCSMNTGVATVKSWRWPVAFHGSLVRYTSPGLMLSVPISLMKWPRDAAMVLTWPGVPVTAWAIMRPERSNTPADRSPASRTEVEKAVRTRVRACSSTTEMSRFHMICIGTSRLAVPAPSGGSADRGADCIATWSAGSVGSAGGF